MPEIRTDELREDHIKVISSLKDGKKLVDEVQSKTELAQVAVMRAALFLQSKGLLTIGEREKTALELMAEGKEYAEKGLPEKRILSFIDDGMSISDLRKKLGFSEAEMGIAVGWAKRKGWISIEKKQGENFVTITKAGKGVIGKETDEESLIKHLRAGGTTLLDDITRDIPEAQKIVKALSKRKGVLNTSTKTERYLELTSAGKKISQQKLEIGKEITQLSTSILKSGEWKKASFRPYDVSIDVSKTYPAKVHILRAWIDRIREVFLAMGFTEVRGPVLEASFWNFDALFQPQDHPARDLADTFYLEDADMELPSKDIVKKVAAVHEDGGSTGSTGWGYKWDQDVARKGVLRTHTTAVSARYLAKVKPPAKIFTIGRTFRNETLDYKHLMEFHQVEGIVVDESVNFRSLLAYLREFYTRLGFSKVRFRPAYFPYTELSVEPEVYMEERGEWIELGGSGIFREEVTAPFGINCPVLAWGLSLERPVMLSLGLEDIRTFYRNDLAFLRETRNMGR